MNTFICRLRQLRGNGQKMDNMHMHTYNQLITMFKMEVENQNKSSNAGKANLKVETDN